MKSKFKRIGMYLSYAVLTNTVYGIILYLLVTWLARYSLLYAYMGNLAMVAFGLAGDVFLLKSLISPKMIARIKKLKNAKGEYRGYIWLFENYISFKSMLYLFYALLLIASQIISFSGITINENLSSFIRTTDYSILLIIAFEAFGERFLQGRRNAEAALTIFKKNWNG